MGSISISIPPQADWATVQKIIYQKTVTLFEIAFLFGWIFGGGNREQLDGVRACAYHLGMAFQIADDLLDASQDALQQSPINIVAVCGLERANVLFETEMASFTQSLRDLGLWNESFQEVTTWLGKYPSRLLSTT